MQANHKINGENVSEDEYTKTCNAIFEKYNFPQERKTVESNYSIDELKKN